jgi:hypothetical protein
MTYSTSRAHFSKEAVSPRPSLSSFPLAGKKRIAEALMLASDMEVIC